MHDAALYRVYAAQCRVLAKKANGEIEETLLKIASAWEQVADDVDITDITKFPQDPRPDRFSAK